MLSITIASPGDIGAILAVAKKSFLETYADKNTPEDLAMYFAEKFTPEQIRSEFREPDCCFFLAWYDDTIAGYAKIRNIEYPSALAGKITLELERIYVLNDFQGKKIGAALIQKCLNEARVRQKDVLWLGVWQENTKAIEFYTKMGFEKFGEHIFRFGSQEQHDDMMKMEIHR